MSRWVLRVLSRDGRLKWPQLIISLPTQTSLRIKALKFTTAKDALGQAPKLVKLFIDRPDLGFDEAEADQATQQFELTEAQATGDEVVELRFVKFVKVRLGVLGRV